jgi:hypothetical protein
MTITYSPTNQEVTEFVGTTGSTVTLTPDASTFIYVESVTCSDDISDLVVTNTESSFTFSSVFSDMFTRVIKFTSQDSTGKKSFATVGRFADLPSTYKGLYQYVPPSVETREITFTISLYSFTDELNPVAPWGTSSPVGDPLYDSYKTTATWVLTVRQNWQASLQALRTAVSSGVGYQQAVAKYPELEL